MRRIALSFVPVALVLAACTADPGPVPVVDIGFGHIHGVDLNPADGMLYAATHTGVFRLDPAGPQRIADRYQDTMGFTIVGPDRFLGSGHPDPRDPGPVHLGLIESSDAARTWGTVSLAGEADFHALSAAGPVVYGWDATSGHVMRSDDGGAGWQRGAQLAVTDLDVDPSDPRRLVLAAEDELLLSTDGGVTVQPLAAQSPQPLVLLDHVGPAADGTGATLAGADRTGAVWHLADAGWERVGTLPGPPQAFTWLAVGRFAAGTAAGVFGSEDGGRTWLLLAAAAH